MADSSDSETPTEPRLAAARPLVIGHRGASAARPENTVEAFRHAAELGADWVELDVRRTADGALVVHHDASLPDGRVIVELARVDLPASVPSLVAALDACAGMGVNVEIKNDPADPDFDARDRVADAVADLLVARSVGPDGTDLAMILVTSFNPRTIDAVRSRAPSVPTGQLVFDLADPAAVVARAVRGGHRSVNPWDPFVDEALIELTRAVGLLVFPWTVDDPARMQVLLDLGVDGIITNVPDVARSLVDAQPPRG
jgi:glycerophosphoryl diester phosphodiesterase